MSNPIKLKYPVTYKNSDGGEETLSELWLGRLKLKHLEILPPDIFSGDEGSIRADLLLPVLPKLIAALADVSLDIAGEIDIEDLEPVVETLQDFFGSTQGTTGGNSPG